MDAERRLRYEPHYLAMVVRPGFPVEILDLGSAETIENAINVWRRPVEVGWRQFSVDRLSLAKFFHSSGSETSKVALGSHSKPPWVTRISLLSRPTVLLGRLPLVALPGKKPGSLPAGGNQNRMFPGPSTLTCIVKSSWSSHRWRCSSLARWPD